MSLRIYNTLERAVQSFVPIEPGHVRMYVCGMTIYDLCHIGHARMMMAFDVVQRWLKASGLKVTYVRNITDIDDKIIRRALERGITIRALTDEMIEAMQRDIGALGIEAPTIEPRATEFVPQMLQLIDRLKDKGLAYQAEGGDVNYAVRKFPGYGKLSGKSLDELRAGERVAVLEGKQDPLDFVMWKSAKASEPDDAKWDSAYGKGRPGWHIECSAMCGQTLGETIDIHGGGADLQFPHHENEIAQSEGANGKPLARFWVHNGFVRVDNEKMSKKRLYTALALVPAQPMDIDWEQAFAARFKAAMDEDFGTPEAVAVLFDLASEINRTKSGELAGLLRALGACLGLLQGDPAAFLQAGSGDTALAGDAVQISQLIAARAKAKQERDFAQADRIRQQLTDMGVVLKDSAAGTTWERA